MLRRVKNTLPLLLWLESKYAIVWRYKLLRVNTFCNWIKENENSFVTSHSFCTKLKKLDKTRIVHQYFCYNSIDIFFTGFPYSQIWLTIPILKRHVPLTFHGWFAQKAVETKKLVGQVRSRRISSGSLSGGSDTTTLNDKCLARLAYRDLMHAVYTRVHLLNEIYAVKVWNR